MCLKQNRWIQPRPRSCLGEVRPGQAHFTHNPPARSGQHRPDHMNPMHFSEICLTWFEAETGLRIEIWMRQYRQIVQNFDPRLMELALEAADIIEKSNNDEMFQT